MRGNLRVIGFRNKQKRLEACDGLGYLQEMMKQRLKGTIVILLQTQEEETSVDLFIAQL
jgi:hypothetical protein